MSLLETTNPDLHVHWNSAASHTLAQNNEANRSVALESAWKEHLNGTVRMRLYQVFIDMHEPHKKLHIYQNLSRELVSLCESYAVHSLDFTEKSWKSGRNQEILIIFRKLLHDLKYWAALDLLRQVLIRDEIRKALLRYRRNISGAVATLEPAIHAKHVKALDIESEEVDVGETAAALTAILSSKEDLKSLMELKGPAAMHDVQSFIDLLDRTMNHSDHTSRFHAQCLHGLRKLCGHARTLPSACTLSDDDLKQESVESVVSGGFADIWRGRYKGKPVALKVLRVYGNDNLKKVKKSFCREAILWKRLSHPNILPFLGASTTLFALCMVSEWMENQNITKYLKRNPHVNRLELLVDIATGLRYLHSMGVLHGDLKGANILIKNDAHACLSDFGLTAVTYDPNTVNAITTSSEAIGSVRWMAPEIIHPEESGLPRRRPSPESDIYALGMVIWEVFTGNVPYCDCPRDATVMLKIMIGVHPERPPVEPMAAIGLSDAVWNLVEMCWQDWRKRPRIPFVLQSLEEAFREFVPTIPVSVTLPDDDASSDVSSDDDHTFMRNDFTVAPQGSRDVSAFSPNSSFLHDGSSPQLAGLLESLDLSTSFRRSPGTQSESLGAMPTTLQWDEDVSD